ncbi:MAG: hypothetical protein IPK07_13815 [Deltaproteobacteria bacterium]|nr:hypothetical protein [Deltaproteobacteria bacterium]
MKAIVTLGWILLALEALFVAMLFVQRNMGDDAAGRGMATGFAIALSPVVLIAGALFLWGQRGGPAPVLWLALAVIYAPVGFGAVTFARGTFRKIDRAAARAQFGKFDDHHLDAIAHAIDRYDVATVSKLVAEAKPDWTRRDRVDHTILGHAIHRAIEMGAPPASAEVVRVLLAAGAPPARDVLSPGRTQRSVTDHELVYHVYGHGEQGAPVLDALLAAGADPNANDEDGRPILFSTYGRVASLEVLARHGAKLDALDTRSDYLGWSPLMFWVQLATWDMARFFLEHGVSPTYTAPDGKNLASILAEVDPPGTQYYGPDEAHHAAFVAALTARGLSGLLPTAAAAAPGTSAAAPAEPDGEPR